MYSTQLTKRSCKKIFFHEWSYNEIFAKPFLQKDRWIAPAYYMSDGRIGGYIFETEEKAAQEIQLIIQRLESKIEWVKKENERRQKETEAENNLIASYGTFLDKNPLKAGKQRKTLETQIRYLGTIYTRKDLIEKLKNLKD